jgi:hypothetical protein
MPSFCLSKPLLNFMRKNTEKKQEDEQGDDKDKNNKTRGNMI